MTLWCALSPLSAAAPRGDESPLLEGPHLQERRSFVHALLSPELEQEQQQSAQERQQAYAGCWPMPRPLLAFSQRGRNVAYPSEVSSITVYPGCPHMQAFFAPDDPCPGVCETVHPALREAAPCLGVWAEAGGVVGGVVL